MKNAEDASSSGPRRAEPAGRTLFDWPERVGMKSVVLGEIERLIQVRRRRRAIGFSLAGAVAAVAVGVVFWLRVPGGTTPGEAKFVVVLPVHRALPDGSTIELKDGADVGVEFTPAVRAVTLRRGTAHFKVAKNPARPFVVTAGGLTVRAVGTAFSVDLAQQRVEVLVTEGRVAVAERGPANPVATAALAANAAMVESGEHLHYDAAANAGKSGRLLVASVVGPDELTAKLAWRVPLLEFSGTPLSRVVAMFNRYNARKLVVADPAMADLQLSGNLRADKIQDLLEMLDQSFQIRAEVRGENEIILHKMPAGSEPPPRGP